MGTSRNLFILCLGLLMLTVSCSVKPQYHDPIPVHDNFKLPSAILGETRVINVWTPPQYHEGATALPVMYMPDGGIKEDFPHIANTLSKLIGNKSIPPFILVGIENTDRHRDLTGASQTEGDARYAPLTDGAAKFRAFISDELFKEIDKRYRTTNKKGIVGESLAGLFVVETMMRQPHMFDYYIAMDPSLWWNNHALVDSAAKTFSSFDDKAIRFWFAGSSGYGIPENTRHLDRVLKASAPASMTWKYSDEPKEKHNTIFRATKERAFKWTLSQI